MSPAPLGEVYAGLEKAHFSRKYAGVRERRRWVLALRDALRSSEEEVYAALEADLHRSPGQTAVADFLPALGELSYLARSLARLARGRAVRGIPLLLFASSRELPMPLGPTLIIVPFNYPLQLALSPAAASVACGNPTAIKMSRATPATAALVESLLSKAGIPQDLLSVVSVGDFSQLWAGESGPRNWAKVFFTGSTDAGREVARNAALTLSSVTLELGGSNPFILAASHASAVCRASSTGRRATDYVLFAKFLNAGQTCISPNYLLVVDGDSQGETYRGVLQELAERLGSLYYSDGKGAGRGGVDSALRSDHLARLITPAARDRVRALVLSAIEDGARVVAPADLEEYLSGGESASAASGASPLEVEGKSGDRGSRASSAAATPGGSTEEESNVLVRPSGALPLDAARFFPPTILDFGSSAEEGSPLPPPAFQKITVGEIFGPVLPVLRVRSFEQALDLIRLMQPTTQSKPLASYLFTDDAGEARVFKETISAGSSVVNSAILQSACHLPFGGVGTSGLGSYHGHYSFETFSHYKPVLHARRPWFHSLSRPNLLPPYKGPFPMSLVAKMMFSSVPTPGELLAILGGVLLGLGVIGLVAWLAVRAASCRAG